VASFAKALERAADRAPAELDGFAGRRSLQIGGFEQATAFLHPAITTSVEAAQRYWKQTMRPTEGTPQSSSTNSR
jgi:hypothetical protein